MGRAPCCDDHDERKKGPWTADEDQKLVDYIKHQGCGNWRTLPKRAGLLRCGKSCRLRWANYLRPDIKRGVFSSEEELDIIQLHALVGNKWSTIAAHIPGRTDNEIKNHWNARLKKRLDQMGIDAVSHMPKIDHLLQQLTSSIIAGYMKQLEQYEKARLEAEALLRSRINTTADSLMSQSWITSVAQHQILRQPDHPQSTNLCSAKPNNDHKIKWTASASTTNSAVTPDTSLLAISNDQYFFQDNIIMKGHSTTEVSNSILTDDQDYNFLATASDERPASEYKDITTSSPWLEDQLLASMDDENARKCIAAIASPSSDIFSDTTHLIKSSGSSTNPTAGAFSTSNQTDMLDFITDWPCSTVSDASEFSDAEANNYWLNMLVNSMLV